MSTEMYDYFKPVSTSTEQTPTVSAMVQRRSLVTAEGVRYFYERMTEVCRVLSQYAQKELPENPAFHKFQSILCADGSDINKYYDPNDPSTLVKNSKGKGWNQYHLNAVADAVSGLFMNAVLQGKAETHETGALVQMIREMTFDYTTLLLADRGYGCLNLIETIRRKPNLECVIRVKEGWINETKNLPLEEFDKEIDIHVITTQRKEDKDRLKEGLAKYLSGKSKFGKYKTSQTWDYESEVDVKFRVVRFRLESGNWETLVTTLGEEYTAEDLKQLYHVRWNGVEMPFRHLKYDTHLAQMHSKLSNSEQQEIYARLTMHNVVSCLMNIAQLIEHEEAASIATASSTAVEDGEASASVQVQMPEKRTKYVYILDRHYATHVICDYFKNANNVCFDIINAIRRNKVPVRLGRSFERNMKSIGFRSFNYR